MKKYVMLLTILTIALATENAFAETASQVTVSGTCERGPLLDSGILTVTDAGPTAGPAGNEVGGPYRSCRVTYWCLFGWEMNSNQTLCHSQLQDRCPGTQTGEITTTMEGDCGTTARYDSEQFCTDQIDPSVPVTASCQAMCQPMSTTTNP